jgi:AcrR family transcriptional regulator
MDQLTKILTTAIELFKNYGFKSITMDDIARSAGISKKTLYIHFANKDEVVKEAVGFYKSNMHCSCVSMLESSENAIEAMVRILAFFDNVFKQMNPMAMHELQRYYPIAYASFRNDIIQTDVALIKENILQGMREGIYRPSLNADLLAKFRLESSMMVLHPNLMVNDREDLLSVALEIGEFFMYGIMTPKGEELYLQYKAKYLNKSNNI